MSNNVESKNNSSIKRANKNTTKTMRNLRLRINKNKLTRKIKAKQKFSVILTKEEIEEKIKYFKKLYGPSSSFRICLQALYYTQFQRTVELNNIISYYLRSLKNFKHILSDLNEDEFEKILFHISSHLNYEKHNKNEIICKYGDKADKFYIILKGKVIFLVPKMNKFYMTEEEYIEHLMKLREYQEIELMKNIISHNQYIYYINNNNNSNSLLDLDEFIFNAIERHENNKENKYSNYLYNKFREYKANREQEKNKDDNNDDNKIKINNISSYEEYIQLTNVNLKKVKDNNKISKKKLVNIFEYRKTNIYSDGDTFGALGVSSKKGKRAATCICYENCHLGIIGKNEYIEFLEKKYEKANDNLYDFVIKNKIYDNMIKTKFVEKYSHMFRFLQYNKNNMIITEKEKLNSLIILYEGEYTLSVNLNLFELNELIVEYKKIKNKLESNDGKVKKSLFSEIEENKKLLISMKNFSQDIKDIIIAKQNFIISNISNSLILGYPNTVNLETNLCLINCKCTSNYANGYIIDKEMLNYIDKENKYIRKTPEIIMPKIDLIIKRLYDFKELIMKKIKDKNLLKKFIIDFNDKNNLVTRNPENKKNKTISNLFDFNQKIISPKIMENKLYISQNNFQNKINDENYYLKLKKDISDKEILLNKTKHLSQKFLLAEKTEEKKFVMKSNNLKNKEKYNDLSIIFSDKPHHKKTILDKFKESKDIDNILDPKIKQLKRNNIKIKNIINLKLVKDKDSDSNNKKIQTITNIPEITNKTTSSLYNAYHENIKTENNFNIITDTFFSSYTNKTTLNDLDTKYISQSTGKNIHSIDLNNRYINSCFNDYQDSYNELYYKYIFEKFNKEKNKENNKLNIDGYKTKNLYTSPNKYIFPSISPFIQEKIKKKENIKKYKYIYIDKSKKTEM